MLNKIARVLYASLTGLFYCRGNPEVCDAATADQKRLGPRLLVIVNDPSEVIWDMPVPPANEKSSYAGDPNGTGVVSQTMAPVNLPNETNCLVQPLGTAARVSIQKYALERMLTMVEPVTQPNEPASQPRMQNHLRISGQRTQSTFNFRQARVYDTLWIDASSMVQGCEETMDCQSLAARSKVELEVRVKPPKGCLFRC